MSKPGDDRQDDLFAPPLEEIINLRHPLVRLAGGIDWPFLGRRFGSVCCLGPGQPPLPTRLIAGLFILKHMYNLSDSHGAIDYLAVVIFVAPFCEQMRAITVS